MSAYTPGPWRYFAATTRHYVLGRDPGPVRERDPIVVTLNASDDRWRDLANARLIAAAPDLLEALTAQEEWEAAEDKHETECAYAPCNFRGCPHDEVFALRDVAIAKRRAAIAKAEGRS